MPLLVFCPLYVCMCTCVCVYLLELRPVGVHNAWTVPNCGPDNRARLGHAKGTEGRAIEPVQAATVRLKGSKGVSCLYSWVECFHYGWLRNETKATTTTTAMATTAPPKCKFGNVMHTIPACCCFSSCCSSCCYCCCCSIDICTSSCYT